MAMQLLEPFAIDGLREDFDINPSPVNDMSINKGFTGLFQIRPEEGGKFIDMLKFNQLLYLMSKSNVEFTTQSFPNWIDDKGDGLPYSYPKNALVKYTDGNIYVSKVDNNTSIPTDTNNWENFEDFGSSGRIGLIDYGYVAKPYHIVAFGGEFNRADYPKLWAYLQANPTLVKTQAQWTTENTTNGMCGFFSDGDGATTFRVPNLDKAFLRPDSRSIASYQADDFKSHQHMQSYLDSTTIVTPSGNISGIWVGVAGRLTESAGGTETRPKNIAVLPLIVAK